ncbi:MAG: outer membrane beta-barrel protein [Gemmatimonadetes bacterium]|nr:outer membrane beta-barrel protein [Gemmatimonadota bacterium]
MRMIGKVLIAGAVMAPMLAAPAAAQNYRWDIGVNGGYSWYSNLMDNDELGFPEAADIDDVKFKSGWLLGAQLGYWARPNIGLRLNATYADRPVVADNVAADLISSVNLWSGSADLMWRFAQPNREWMGTEVLPYLALGLGAKWINASGDAFTCVDPEDGNESCGPFTVTDGVTTAGPYGMPDQRRLMGLVGLGTDVRLSPNFALRLEVNDRIYKPHVFAIDAGNTYQGESVGKTVHEVAGQVGLHLLMGLDRPQYVSVIPAPAPPPAPTPAPAPVEEAVTVCVVDPTVRSGLRMQSAYYRPATRDTVVMVNGQRVPLHNAVGSVMVVRDADWYVRGEPLVLRVGSERFEYVAYQGARRIDADALAYLGTINGYPVYADRDEVADVVDAMASARDAERSGDLSRILDQRADLRDEINDVEYLYVPIEPTGCIFQTLQPMAPVLKGR